MGHQAHAGRVVGRIGVGGRGGCRARGRCERRRWLDPHPGRVQRSGRPEAESRPDALRTADRRAHVRYGGPRCRGADRARQRWADGCHHRRNQLADFAGAMPSRKFVEVIKKKPRKLRIGFLRPVGYHRQARPGVVKAVEATAQLLTDLATTSRRSSPPYDDKALAETFRTSVRPAGRTARRHQGAHGRQGRRLRVRHPSPWPRSGGPTAPSGPCRHWRRSSSTRTRWRRSTPSTTSS